MRSFELTDVAIGELFTIPHDAWVAIENRVRLVLLAKPAAATIATSIPPFADLVSLCEKWPGSTFPSIVAESHALAAYADRAIAAFTALRQKIERHEPNVLADARVALGALAAATRTRRAAFAPVTAGVVAFAEQNAAVDDVVGRDVARLGPEWRSLAGEGTALERASGLVHGAWSAIGDDLDAMAGETFDLTMEFLLGLDIESAILAWTNIVQRSRAFAEGNA